MMKPTIHLNGTSKEALGEQYCDAYDAVGAAIKKLAEAAPNARDYYPQSVPEPSSDYTVNFLRANGLALTRDNYLYVEYLGNPPELDGETEAELPAFLQEGHNEED